jgi:hypothetical protein
MEKLNLPLLREVTTQEISARRNSYVAQIKSLKDDIAREKDPKRKAILSRKAAALQKMQVAVDAVLKADLEDQNYAKQQNRQPPAPTTTQTQQPGQPAAGQGAVQGV